MKKLLITTAVMLLLSISCYSQVSHLTRIYDFEGKNFENSVKAMAGTNDSLYIICKTPDGKGLFFTIDGNGGGYRLIWKFDNVNWAPNSLVANDTVIYGTTRFSKNGGGTIFRYSLKDYSFEFIKDFTPYEVQDTRVKYVTDSVLWLTSESSFVDKGSIFTINKDGSGFKKIFNDTNMEKGQNPADFVFYNDSIYIACYNGGGTYYPDGTGSFTSCGCFIRIKSDGTGYQKLIMGGLDKGTQPQSILIRENKLIGLFAHTGNNTKAGGQFFRCNLNGTSYDSIGALSSRSLTRMLSTDSLIYGISSYQIFGVNPFNGEIRIYDDLKSHTDFGYDMTANPALLNENVYMAAQQGGPGGGGTILKWENKAPEVHASKTYNDQTPIEINLNDLFTDPEGDKLTYNFEYDSNSVTVSELNGRLTITPLKPGVTKVKITANDGWKGHKTYSLSMGTTTSVIEPKEKSDNLLAYPNPTNSILNFSTKDFESVEILSLNGHFIRSYKNPGSNINIISLRNGVYIIRCKLNGCFLSQLIVKN